jgi:excinuclease UvrABC ATPase subunit
MELRIKTKRLIIRKKSIYDLKLANKKATQISNKLNKELSNLRIKIGKEKKSILKKHKTEIKYWRKELGDETKLKIKLEEKLMESAETPLNLSADMFGLQELKPVPLSESSTLTSDQTLCSICASPIPNFVPKLFHIEPFNHACENCDDSAWMSDSSSDEISLQGRLYVFQRRTCTAGESWQLKA